MTLPEIAKDIIKKTDSKLSRVYFVACGGSLGGFYPAHYFLLHESKKLTSAMITSNEFVHAAPPALSDDTLVVACSMRGTPETGEAVRVAKERGALTASLYIQPSRMTELSDYVIPYESISLDETSVDKTNASLGLRLVMELSHRMEGYPHMEDANDAFERLDGLYREASDQRREDAKRFADAVKDEPVIYVIGGGPSMGAAYIFSICNLMEMQWIHSPTVNSGEYLHGPFETLDETVPVFVIVSDGRTRPVDLRALNFVRRYGKKIFVLDAWEIGIPKLPESVREYYHHSILSSLLNNVYLRELAAARNHPYQSRRYMWKVEY